MSEKTRLTSEDWGRIKDRPQAECIPPECRPQTMENQIEEFKNVVSNLETQNNNLNKFLIGGFVI